MVSWNILGNDKKEEKFAQGLKDDCLFLGLFHNFLFWESEEAWRNEWRHTGKKKEDEDSPLNI